MAFTARHDVHEGQRFIIFVDFVRGQLAPQNLGENVVGIIASHELLPHGTDRLLDLSQAACPASSVQHRFGGERWLAGPPLGPPANTSWAASVNRHLTSSEHSGLPVVERQWLCRRVAGSLACEQIGKRPRWGFTTVRRFEGGLCAMMGGASGHRERRGDTLIAAAVLVVLVAGWVQGLSIA